MFLETIVDTFSKFGPVFVDWPVISNNAGTLEGSTRAGKYQTGYLFVVYEEERSVQMLMRSCYEHEGKTYLLISSPTIKHKPVEVRPWRLSDINFMLQADMPINHRRTVFIGAMPRPITAGEVARHMNDLYGPVCYAGILVDPELQYPKGAARVTFATEKGFLNALNAKFMLLPHDGARKRVEIKPYIMEDSACDECGATQSDGSSAIHFCLDPSCAQYFCEQCWSHYHSADMRLMSHRPFIRNGQLTWVGFDSFLFSVFVNCYTHIGGGCIEQLMPSPSTTTEADGVPDNCEEPMAV
ncbi:unnamed protein product [Toxocara canis]|uniref:RRM domain-containing protein n=1 Tax=Toxocara canis TaxID=6265 RepID=A0A183VEN6_TOXCA|nr:unnamed protein product [Toxocara canis]